MDYGKLAYMKAEELESRIAAADGQKTGGAYGCYYPRVSLKKPYSLCSLGCDGSTALIFKLVLRTDGACSVRLSVLVGDYTASIETCFLSEGMNEHLVMTGVNFSGTQTVTVCAEGADITLVQAQVTALGDAALSGGSGGFAADYNGESQAYAYAKDADIFVSETGGQPTDVGRGMRLDFAAAGDGYALVYNDDLGNLWAVRLGADCSQLRRVRIGDAADDIALTVCGGRLLCALLRGGAVSGFTCDFDFGNVSYVVQTDVGITADAISFVKHSERPMLAVSSGGSVYLKISGLDKSANARFTVNMRCTVALAE